MAAAINVPAQQPNITAAITAEAPFDTIRAAPGVYNELVISAQAGVDARTRSGTAATESIITNINVSGIIQATNARVDIDGFTIHNNTAGPGIFTSGSGSGYWIFNNIIRNSTFAIYLLSDGALETEVRHNLFQSNTQPGAGSGNGVFSEARGRIQHHGVESIDRIGLGH